MVRVLLVEPPDRGRTVLEPLRGVGRGLVDLSAVLAFVEHQALFYPNFPHGMWVYSRAINVARLTHDVLHATLTLRRAHPVSPPRDHGPAARWRGGPGGRGRDLLRQQVERVPARPARCDLLGAGFEQERDWAREGWAALAPPHAGAYVNSLMEEGEDRVRVVRRRAARLGSGR